MVLEERSNNVVKERERERERVREREGKNVVKENHNGKSLFACTTLQLTPITPKD